MSEFRLMIVALLLVTILAIFGQGKTWPLKTKAAPAWDGFVSSITNSIRTLPAFIRVCTDECGAR